MVAGNCDSDFVEIGKSKHGMGCAVCTGRGAKNPHAIHVQVRKTRAHLLDHGDMIFEGPTEVFVREQMKRPRTPRSAAAVNHHHDEAQFCHRLQSQRSSERFGDEKILRPSVNMLDDGIFFVGIEVGWPPDQRVQVRGSVGGFALK